MTGTKTPFHPIDRLLEIMARLRDPDTGCPWDLEQSFRTIAPYIDRRSLRSRRRHRTRRYGRSEGRTRRSALPGRFLPDVPGSRTLWFRRNCRGHQRQDGARHPHVFGDASVRTEEQQTRAWEEQKAAEREAVAKPGGPVSALDGVARALPALMRAESSRNAPPGSVSTGRISSLYTRRCRRKSKKSARRSPRTSLRTRLGISFSPQSILPATME